SVAAFTAETIEAKGIETIEDIATFTPNLDIKGSRGTGNTSPTYQIRGLSGGGGATGERAAALYIDGVFVPRTTGPFMSMLDVERVEVLRGPQGTLFGRNSTGGAIRVFTRRPGPDMEGYVELGFGNFDRREVDAMVNVPLSDSVFLRVQGGYFEQDGYVRRGSQNLGSSEDTIGRVQLAYEPSDALSVRLSYSTSDAESDGNPQDLAWFDMRPHLDFEDNRADWISEFLEASGQPRIGVRSVRRHRRMAHPRQPHADVDHRPVGLLELRDHGLGGARHRDAAERDRVGSRISGAAARHRPRRRPGRARHRLFLLPGRLVVVRQDARAARHERV